MQKLNTKAFILAAGFGTRLKPFTDTLPKALVPYKKKPMIENVIHKLKNDGFKDIFINTHHFSGLIKEYFKNRKGEENITLIYENEILGTGGAVKNAKKYLKNSDNFIVYNTDVDCDASINLILKYHLESGAIATLGVQDRKTSRFLLTDINGRLIGRTENGEDIIYAEDSQSIMTYKYKAFCGIHIISAEIFDYLYAFNYPFDIIPVYMHLIKLGKLLLTYDLSGISWKDLGIPENLD